MRTSKNRAWMTGLALLLLLGGGAQLAAREADYGDDYAGGDYGRIRDAEQGVRIVRAQWNHESGVVDESGMNAPIFPGDRMTTGSDQRVEVELAGGTLIWVDRRSDLTFLALPDPYADVADNSVLQLADGRLRLSSMLDEGQELRIDTPAASVYPLGDAELRVEIGVGGVTRVFSWSGVVEVVGSGGSILLRGGMRTEVEPDALPYEPEPFNTFSGDGFDRYAEAREQAYAYDDYTEEAYRELPDEVRPYYRELSANGNWVWVDDYGYLWQPVDVAPDWRPYNDGYWAYGPRGYFWVSHERWGWAPYHYGRWSWLSGYGWCWSPGRVFAGAWVSWSWGSAYVGWSPLDYWGYPAYRSVAHYGYYDPFGWTFISFRHLHYGGHHHHSYRHHHHAWDHVYHDVRHNAVLSRPPRHAPERLVRSEETRRRAMADARDRDGRRVGRADAERPDRSFRQDERSARGRRGGDDGSRKVATAPPRGRTRTVPVTAGSSGRRGTRAKQADRGRERLPVVTQPRSSRGSSVRTKGETPRSSLRGTSKSERSSTARRGGADDRVRDIYRDAAKPRRTREQPSASSGSRSGSGGSSPKAKAPTGRSRTTPKAKAPSGRSRTTPKASGSNRSRGGSSTKSSRPQYRSEPRASRSSGSRSSAPKMSRSSTSRRSEPRASRSSGSRSSAPKVSRSSTSRRSAPKASRSSGSRSSAPKASRSSGSRSSGPKASRSSSRGGSRKSSKGRKR